MTTGSALDEASVSPIMGDKNATRINAGKNFFINL
jgi:hypothetical protein